MKIIIEVGDRILDRNEDSLGEGTVTSVYSGGIIAVTHPERRLPVVYDNLYRYDRPIGEGRKAKLLTGDRDE